MQMEIAAAKPRTAPAPAAKPSTISPRTLAVQHNVALQTVYFALWTGKLRATKRAGQWVITQAAVEEWLKRTGRASA